MIQAINLKEDVDEIDFTVQLPWGEKAGSRGAMQFVIEKESHMNGKLSPVYCSRAVPELGKAYKWINVKINSDVLTEFTPDHADTKL